MATTITAGNATNGAAISSDNTGILELRTGTGGGTTAMTINASQNVGIGTSSPNYALQVTRSGLASYVANTDGTGTLLSGVNGSGLGVYGTFSNTAVAFFSNSSEQARITTAGLFQFNSGYGSVATAFGCRAWVNFNGTANTNLSGTYSQSGTTVTVTATAHGLIAGNSINADITTGTAVDGAYTVATVTDANTFTYTAGTSLTTSGNITLVRSTIRASGNVSSITDNGVGLYTVNLTTAMPDVNYSVSSNANDNGVGRSTTNLGNPTVSSFIISVTGNGNNTAQDAAIICVNVFR
jgi:hypothetical protein